MERQALTFTLVVTADSGNLGKRPFTSASGVKADGAIYAVLIIRVKCSQPGSSSDWATLVMAISS